MNTNMTWSGLLGLFKAPPPGSSRTVVFVFGMCSSITPMPGQINCWRGSYIFMLDSHKQNALFSQSLSHDESTVIMLTLHILMHVSSHLVTKFIVLFLFIVWQFVYHLYDLTLIFLFSAALWAGAMACRGSPWWWSRPSPLPANASASRRCCTKGLRYLLCHRFLNPDPLNLLCGTPLDRSAWPTNCSSSRRLCRRRCGGITSPGLSMSRWTLASSTCL